MTNGTRNSAQFAPDRPHPDGAGAPGARRPPVSVIVCAFNAADHMRDTLDSLLAQSYPNIEILVINDASTDNSLEIAERYAARDDRVRVQSHPENRGIARARQTGVHEARHDLLTFLDADDIALPQMVERLVETLLSDDALLGVSAYRVYFDGTRDLGVQKIGPTSRAAYRTLYEGQKLLFLPFPTLVRKTDLLAAGGYRVDIPLDDGVRHADFCEDLDTWCRMSDLSADGRYFLTLEEPLSKYRKHLASASTTHLGHMQNKMRWIRHCLHRRRAGQAELSYAEFLDGQTMLDRLTNARQDFAALSVKKAGFAYSQGHLVRLGFHAVMAALASPKLVRQKLRSQSRSR